MMLALNIYEIDKTNIIFGNKEINLIHNYNFFYKIIYSTCYYVMNGIFINLILSNYKKNNYYNYCKIIFDVQNNIRLINLVYEMEQHILSGFENNGNVQYNLHNELMRGIIKVSKKSKYTTNIVLRITGVWENNTNIGLSYKFDFI
jgi:hypothetical protein